MALKKSIEFLLLIINYSFSITIKYILKTQQVSVARICCFNAYLLCSNITNVSRSDEEVFLPFQVTWSLMSFCVYQMFPVCTCLRTSICWNSQMPPKVNSLRDDLYFCF